MNLVKEKIAQAEEILAELEIDLWLTLAREAESVPDPAASLISDQSVCWLTAFFITPGGANTVLVGGVDAPDYERSGLYPNVVIYREDVGERMRSILAGIDPRQIAINFSKSSYTADGLSHGLYLMLQEYLEGTAYGERLLSAEKVIALLRGRKTPLEIERLRRAAAMADHAWEATWPQIEAGMTESQIAALLENAILSQGVTPAFETIVNAGSKTAPGHGSPTEAPLEKGELLHVDFGVRYRDYCSDIQRVVYLRRDGETGPPDQLVRAFACVRKVIETAGEAYRPGRPGHTIDALARQILTDAGYPEYNHALGHQIGQSVHDGGALVGPPWKRYGEMVQMPLEENSSFTIELGITLDGIGHVSLEEDLLVTSRGGASLGPQQTELAVI
ncbi:MAG: Xaa-Pro peptidase family protein [Desulfosarcinaceae bacterium]|nr:Xaa-Pro peptidase family protein [Desulfosarcinaceae bacterium]